MITKIDRFHIIPTTLKCNFYKSVKVIDLGIKKFIFKHYFTYFYI